MPQDEVGTAVQIPGAETTEKSIVLQFSDCTLAFTGLEDGYSIGLTWTTPEETRHYRIRSTEVSFVQMNAYMKGYMKRQ